VGEQGAGAGDFGGVGAVLLRDAGFGGADVCWGLLVGACIEFGGSFLSEWMLLGGGFGVDGTECCGEREGGCEVD